MPAAALSVVMNIALAALFAASYAIIAVLHTQNRAPVWFAASYAIGMLAPVCQLGLASGIGQNVFTAAIFLTFATALFLMVPALTVFYGRPLPWRLMAALAAATALCGAGLVALGGGTDRRFSLIFQLPFMLATAACAWTVLRWSPRKAGDLGIAALFAVTALHFPIKAFLAPILGTSVNPARFVVTPLGLISQASTAVLLVATGLAVFISVVLSMVNENRIAAETDMLSGILNRRGFEERAVRVLSGRQRGGVPAALLLLDLDHFKRVNDTLGHAGGDRAIRWFAAMLLDTAPKSAVVARLGGEEFGILLDRTPLESARLQAEAIRHATLSHVGDDVPPMTVSIGVTNLRPGDLLATALERADAALYAAKDAGRNTVCLAPAPEGGTGGDNVVVLRRAGEA